MWTRTPGSVGRGLGVIRVPIPILVTCVLVPLNFTSTYHSIAIVLVRTDR